MAETSEVRRAAVYRLYAADDELLYVGYSARLEQRLDRHAATKSWWPEVSRRVTEWHDSEELAAAAETVAIGTERPRYNIHKQAIPMRHPDFALAASGTADLEFDMALAAIAEAVTSAAAIARGARDATTASRRAMRLVEYAGEFRGQAAALRTETVASLRLTEGLTLQQMADRLEIGLPTVQKVLEREKRAERERRKKHDQAGPG